MALKDLIPWRKEDGDVAVRRTDEHPFVSLRRDMDRLFDSFSRGFGLEPFGTLGRATAFTPNVDVSETEKDVKVTAELPGLDKEDIDVSLANDALTIKGEKKEEKEDTREGHYRVERCYGSFSRTIRLPAAVETDKVKAQFKKGVLSITLPKTPEAVSSRKKIAVTAD